MSAKTILVPLITATAILALTLIPLGYLNANWVKLRRVTIEADEVNGSLKIALVSDLHIDTSHLGSVEKQALALLASAKPDLIVIAGDLVSSSRGVPGALEFVKRASRVAPVVVVWGNWDHQSNVDLHLFKCMLESLGNVKVLVNQHRVYTINNSRILVIGVDDPYTGFANLTRALEGAPKGLYTILAAHSPQIIGEAAGKVDLVLAGHTHAGQIVIPLLGPLYVPLPRRYRKYWYGLYEVNGTYLYVTSGLGSVPPIRLGTNPEVAIIEVKPSSKYNAYIREAHT